MIRDFKPVTLRGAVFYYDIQDFINDNGITAAGALGPAFGSNCLYNIDHFELYGAELEAAIHIGKKFRATAAYIYQEYDVTNTGFEAGFTYYLPALLPKHKVKLLAGYNIWPDSWIQLSSRYVGERGTQRGGKLDDYVTFDLAFEQILTFQARKYKAEFYVNNLTGTDYQEISGYDMPKYIWGFQVGVQF